MDLVVDCSRKGVNLGLYASGANCEFSDANAKGDALGLLLDRLLKENNFELSQIERVLVTLGPGSFTGIRAGIAFCEGLCFSGKRTLHGVSTLKALASHFPEGEEVILHARANFYYVLKNGCESLIKSETQLQTHGDLSITPFAKLIPQIEPSKTQKANYLMNPYNLNA